MEKLIIDTIEGEVGLVIDYEPGKSEALTVLQSAMRLIQGLDALDHALLSSINTSLEPVSILNDVQHSSLKMLLKRVLKAVPDDALGSLEWRAWVGGILVKGKHKLLAKLDSPNEEIQSTLNELKQDYLNAPNSTVGYEPPQLEQTLSALNQIKSARAIMPNSKVTFQTELGDIDLPYVDAEFTVESITTETNYKSTGRDLFKVKSPDMLGNAQWKVKHAGRAIDVKITHESWLNEYHARSINIAPHDSLDADYTQEIMYDDNQVEVSNTITLTYIHRVVLPPENKKLF